jgi:hypothetical protein
MATTRKQLKADLFEAARMGDRELTDRLFTLLVFWGAQPYEYRGVADARLEDYELAMISGALVNSCWFEPVHDALCTPVCADDSE